MPKFQNGDIIKLIDGHRSYYSYKGPYTVEWVVPMLYRLSYKTKNFSFNEHVSRVFTIDEVDADFTYYFAPYNDLWNSLNA